ncbi:hypothetical protein [Cohnella sp. REN36]|uniref:hypothetical protein n=1 Tax=Cohnella sp. REN36 TaxID=2887347 RepID=UPI001D1570A4|nr:hypothetical protein [Cohnella sp. REN36]MCC3374131.1 hypothetical protein [Cohnella sp. REN36]
MRPAAMAAFAILVVAAMGIAFYGLWMNEHGNEQVYREKHGFPIPAGVTSVVVLDEAGRAHVSLDDATSIGYLMKQLAEAPRSYFGDPEPSGTLYRVEMRRGDGRTLVYMLSDLRTMGGSQVKLYPENPGRNEVWELSGGVISMLIDRAEPASQQAA